MAVYLALSVICEAPDVPDEAPDVFMNQTPAVEVREHPTGILFPGFSGKAETLHRASFFLPVFCVSRRVVLKCLITGIGWRLLL